MSYFQTKHLGPMSLFHSFILNKIIILCICAYICWVEKRQRGRFAGFSLYVSNTGDIKGSTLCYTDGPQLPPLNFTTTCTEYGRYVIFYNERKNGVIYPNGYQLSTMYTELCEVIVKGISYFSNCNAIILCPSLLLKVSDISLYLRRSVCHSVCL